MSKSQYCTDQELEEITEILKKWAGSHPEPDKEWKMAVVYGDKEEILTPRRIYEGVRGNTFVGDWLLKEFRRLADEHNMDIVELVRNGFKDGGPGRGCSI